MVNKVTLFLVGLGYGKYYQGEAWIFDTCGHLVSHGKTCNGKYSFRGCENTCYIIKVVSYLGRITKSFVARDRVVIYLNGRECRKPRITQFLLTDYYYDNLPIMKGELYFG